MKFNEDTTQLESAIELVNYLPEVGEDDIIREIIIGLEKTPKRISSIFFYDETGSKLFEEITRLPEYYPTRTEKSILKEMVKDLKAEFNSVDIVELGSGDCSKISIILSGLDNDALSGIRYIPVDVSASAIDNSGLELLDKYAGLDIRGIVADFTKQLDLIPSNRRRIFLFLGSTIGNLNRNRAEKFIIDLSNIMRNEDTLIIGFDMVKDDSILYKAYNDSAGITARFNLNILNVINSIAGMNFNIEKFKHRAFFNDEKSRIEMHLEALIDNKISGPHLKDDIIIKKGEMIHTENSHKYTRESINALAQTGGLEIGNIYTDESNWFSLVQMYKPGNYA